MGSVVKTSEEDDPIAVFTVLNTCVHREAEWMRQLRDFLAATCKDEANRKKMIEVRGGL